jgi:hypothetical protein
MRLRGGLRSSFAEGDAECTATQPRRRFEPALLKSAVALPFDGAPFTFRFRWEDGRLRFYTLGLGRFDRADIRRSAMAQISDDVGLWQQIDGSPTLTSEGRLFLEQTFAA